MEGQNTDLIGSYISNIINFCDDWLNQAKDRAGKFPDGYIPECVPNDFPESKLAEIKGEPVTFSCADGLSYTLYFQQPYLDDFRKAKAFPVNQKGHLSANSITLWKGKSFTGLAIAGNNRWFNVGVGHFFGVAWANVWDKSLPDGLHLTGENAYLFWLANINIYKSFEAEIFALAIRQDPIVLSEIKLNKPYLLDYPVIQVELAEAFKKGRIQELPTPKGRPLELTKEKLELYHWVYFYRFSGMSLGKSCEKAISKHPTLVPADWYDTNDTLKKTVVRLDKIPSISQKQGFIEFKKLKKDKK